MKFCELGSIQCELCDVKCGLWDLCELRERLLKERIKAGHAEQPLEQQPVNLVEVEGAEGDRRPMTVDVQLTWTSEEACEDRLITLNAITITVHNACQRNKII